MKYSNKLLISFAVALAVSSCSVFNSNKKNVEKNEPTTKTIVATTPTPTVAPTTTPTSDVAKTHLPSVEKQIAGEWTIISVYNKKIVAQDKPFLNFEVATDKVFGNNGCNVINGNFEVSSVKKELRITNVITSLMACPDYKSESILMRAISEIAGYNFVTIKNIIHLNLLDRRGSTIIQLKRHNLNDLNGAWTVKEIDGNIIDDKNVKLVIDIQELKLHGNSGCNIINGTIALDPNKDNAIQFLQIVSTRKMCPNMSTEMALMVALEEIETYKKINTNEIVFYDYKKQPTLTLKRLNLKR